MDYKYKARVQYVADTDSFYLQLFSIINKYDSGSITSSGLADEIRELLDSAEDEMIDARHNLVDDTCPPGVPNYLG